MKRFLAIVAFAAFLSSLLHAQDKTLRIDYIFSGTAKSADISLDCLSSIDGWAGRTVNMDKVPVKGNGQISMTDLSTGNVIYRQSFSSLFQEWQTTEEATLVRKSFENVMLLPMPQSKARVTIELYDVFGSTMASLSHIVDPEDILIRRLTPSNAPFRYVHKGGDPKDCIDVAIVAEGYTAEQAEDFYADARRGVESILSYAPFDKYADKFNFIAVALPSQDSGVSVPSDGVWKNTALGSNYDTFYSERYLTTLNVKQMHDCLCGIPYEHIAILANCDTYGGGGIFNTYTLTTSKNKDFPTVIIHEFGHSFAGLADEYYYDDQYSEYYYPGFEPWEQNITTLENFGEKWADMLLEGTAVPTAPMDDASLWQSIASGACADSFVGVYEGAGYQSKGVYRPFPDCRMKTLSADIFCPVCQRAIENVILYHLIQLSER